MNIKRLTSRALAATALIAAWVLSAGASAAPAEDAKARLAKAEAMFAERCKKSGEFIHRTVDNVEGVFLMKLRPQKINYSDQFALDDPYGRDAGGSGYIDTFLRGSYERTRSASPRPGWPQRVGYLFVARENRERIGQENRGQNRGQTQCCSFKIFQPLPLSVPSARRYEEASWQANPWHWEVRRALRIT